MLVLTIRTGSTKDDIILESKDAQIRVEILAIKNGRIRVGIHAGEHIKVSRRKSVLLVPVKEISK